MYARPAWVGIGGSGANQIGERAARSPGSGAAGDPSDAWLEAGGAWRGGGLVGDGPAQAARASPASQVAAQRHMADIERGDCGSVIATPVGLTHLL